MTYAMQDDYEQEMYEQERKIKEKERAEYKGGGHEAGYDNLQMTKQIEEYKDAERRAKEREDERARAQEENHRIDREREQNREEKKRSRWNKEFQIQKHKQQQWEKLSKEGMSKKAVLESKEYTATLGKNVDNVQLGIEQTNLHGGSMYQLPLENLEIFQKLLKDHQTWFHQFEQKIQDEENKHSQLQYHNGMYDHQSDHQSDKEAIEKRAQDKAQGSLVKEDKLSVEERLSILEKKFEEERQKRKTSLSERTRNCFFHSSAQHRGLRNHYMI
jgi:hypothetical protein